MVKLAKKIIFKTYVICLMTFAVWYGYFMYPLIFGFEGKEAAGISLKKAISGLPKEQQVFERKEAEQPKERKSTNLGYRLIEQPYIKGRFHHIGFTVEQDKASTCIRCHGNAPHAASKRTRAFLNMHGFYLACETCHVRPKAGEPVWTFRWYDKDTGKPSENPKAILDIEDNFKRRQLEREYPIYGDYGVKIAPMLNGSGKYSLLHSKDDVKAVEQYIAERDQLSFDEKVDHNKHFHRKVSLTAVECSNCHRDQDTYIPFARLGYPPSRLRELTNNPVVNMLHKYTEFHIPSLMRGQGEATTGAETY